MAFVNMFNDRVEQFNLREENERLAELFSDEKLQEEAQWQAYSVKEISRLFSISEEEALKLMNCGLFKTYRVGNEYRASKKSVEENKKIVKADAFTVSDACIGCGKCVQLCPLNNIRLDKDKPVWGSNCTHCMACICYCPKEAIEYGKRSVGKPRYHFEALGVAESIV